ncbi:recombination protein NinB [Pseudorhodoferax sp. Leaf274]|uniref:recombination protein NinB n=1 Tax=Pseudorhodoferax sp. Leaf274 TaxID=1736318 RepID=UPI000702771D|nr:recombination protein NinB [Pseudorhodoferax sp. Leaf274]KQP36124.1 hypothetical protein ASF44_16270 [Pseudorhodoferax sp. Leaf274]
MADKRTFKLVHGMARANAVSGVQQAPEGYVVTIQEPTRSLDQNAAMWPILDAFARQLEWPVNGAMVRMSAEEWKDVLSAAYRRETVRVAQGLDGGMVMLGSRTSKFSVREMSGFIEFLHATAALRGVVVYELEVA